MQFTLIEFFDLFLRVLIVGQVLTLCLYLKVSRKGGSTTVAILFAICFCGYILLTAPIPDRQYGVLRGILLFFTELAPFMFWLLAYRLLVAQVDVGKWHIGVKCLLLVGVLWFAYFFGVQQGRGFFHDMTHAVQFALLLHVIYFSLQGLNDDLVNGRRNLRFLFVTCVSLYLSFIVVLELFDASLRGLPSYQLLNVLVVFASTTAFAWCYFKGYFKDTTKSSSATQSKENSIADDIPVEFRSTHQQLQTLMASRFYTETQLTISQLADKLNTPEHQLRNLINQHLGFKNFSEYLNSYRLPDACEALENIENVRKPVLTIALELGYGSIATFNRAFKAKIGKTPKEYRDQFQK